MGYEAIIVVVERGKANAVVDKASKAGAKGATIAYGRGSGEHVFSFFRSLQIEPAKEIICVISRTEDVDRIYDTVVEAAQIEKKGMGIAFTIPLGRFSATKILEEMNGKK